MHVGVGEGGSVLMGESDGRVRSVAEEINIH